MRIGTLFLIIILIATAAFAALNWGTFMTPTTLTLWFANFQAPLGLIMLGLMAFITGVFLLYLVFLQTSILIETRRHARELQASKELAEQAEASRFTELRRFMNEEIEKQATINAESRAVVLERLEQFEQDIRTALNESANSISAYIGELEDRIEKSNSISETGK